jgi:M6 family metalloprotease-like protein
MWDSIKINATIVLVIFLLICGCVNQDPQNPNTSENLSNATREDYASPNTSAKKNISIVDANKSVLESINNSSNESVKVNESRNKTEEKIIPKTGCKFNNPHCLPYEDCINNTCVLKKGCDYLNPPCAYGYACINNSCVLKSGCNYNNPACAYNYECISNACVLKKGCINNNPPCGKDYDCINNSCTLKKGCNYNNPTCSSNSYCHDNSCISCISPSTSSWNYPPANPVSGSDNLLVILWDPHRPDHPAPSKSQVENLIFGPDPSVKGYFLENSQNRYSLKKAAILGWYDADKPADHYWNHSNYEYYYGNECCEDNFKGGHSEKWAEAILKADKDFDYSKYDSNKDGILQPTELGILIVIPQNNPFGTNRPVVAQQCPSEEPLYVDGVKVSVMAEAYIGNPPDASLVAHELSHLFFGAPDMYFIGFWPYAAGSYSLMDANYYMPHLDPYNKLRLGWLDPKVVTSSGCYSLRSMSESGESLILIDTSHSTKEYFIIENRQNGRYYDSNLADTGLGIWHIMEDKSVYSTLSKPYGVSEKTWSIVGKNEWGRLGIRMIRPVYGPPFNNYKALWDGSDPETGYDVYLNWADGSYSGFAIRNISASNETMHMWIDKNN